MWPFQLEAGDAPIRSAGEHSTFLARFCKPELDFNFRAGAVHSL
jgi:hypothetical protein